METDLQQLKILELSNTNFKNNVIIIFKEIKVKLETWKLFKKVTNRNSGTQNIMTKMKNSMRRFN